MVMETKAPKGTQDIIAPEVYGWQHVERIAHAHFRFYNYHEIRTPIFEHLELFQRSVGESTDIVKKQMYVFTDLSGREYVLRPENTASVCRAFIEHSMQLQPGARRVYYIGPMFRYEKMQKGRFRQFHQIGIEVLGDEHPATDAEVIQMGYSFLERIRCTNLEVEICSVGCPKCRPAYNDALKEKFSQCIDKMCDDCKDRLVRNPLRILDCKNEKCAPMIEKAPRIFDYLCEECTVHFEKVKYYIEKLDVHFSINPFLVRGLDYYTKTAFEIKSGSLGSQNSVLGGGRYDGLIADLGGPPVCGIGFAIGIERMLLSMEDPPYSLPPIDYFIIPLNEDAIVLSLEISKAIRMKDMICEVAYEPKSMKSALRLAHKLNAKKTILLGEDEVKQKILAIKDMLTGEQVAVPVAEFMKQIAG